VHVNVGKRQSSTSHLPKSKQQMKIYDANFCSDIIMEYNSNIQLNKTSFSGFAARSCTWLKGGRNDSFIRCSRTPSRDQDMEYWKISYHEKKMHCQT
jgi:hypothetical protein